ncbi:transcription initiation factor TFIID subunit 7 family protein [Sporobolomyces salmoneus]|uniref:transcription initiation factor TFIID subunit 7 family protein n=1 Tax=Sporobolomyces salmoneus TaxID=183962 RepID=UPI00318285FB
MQPIASTSAGGGGTIAATRPRRQRRVNRLINNSDDEFEGSSRRGRGGDDEIGGGRRLRLKVGPGGSGGGHHIGPADTVGWDRELDSDPEEPLAVEEHFVLRVPPEIAPRLKDLADKRDLPPDVWFKFKDSRRAVFHMGNKLYGAKLVDLPALLESQRLTGVGGQTVKVADVSQMLLVEEEIQEESQVTAGRTFNIEDFVYPHGITPPLKHVRKRRFRRRINRRTIEQVETAVEKLLEADAKAEKVQFEMLDYDVPSDDEEYEPARDSAGFGGSVGAPTPRPDGAASSPAVFGENDEGSARGDNDEGDREEDDDDDEEGGSGYDSDLANEINKGLEAMGKSDEEDSEDGDGLFGGSSDDDEEEEEDQVQEQAIDPQEAEARKRIKLLAEEMGDLDKAIASKETELAKAANPIFKKRFEEMIKKLTVDRDSKRAQHTAAVRELDKKREDAAHAATEAAANVPSAESVVLPVAGSSNGAAGTGNAMDTS